MSMLREIDDESKDGYSGTFRWKKEKILGNMPQLQPRVTPQFNEDGWMCYFMTRCPVGNECARFHLSLICAFRLIELLAHFRLISSVRSDLSFIDCLSSPCSIAYFMHEIIFKRLYHILSELPSVYYVHYSGEKIYLR